VRTLDEGNDGNVLEKLSKAYKKIALENISDSI